MTKTRLLVSSHSFNLFVIHTAVQWEVGAGRNSVIIAETLHCAHSSYGLSPSFCWQTLSDISSGGISWIQLAIFFFIPPLKHSFPNLSRFSCTVLASACVGMCEEFRFVRRRGLSCQSRPLQWSSQIPPFSRTLTVTFLHSSTFSSSPGDSGRGGRRLRPAKAAASLSQTDC